MHTLNIEAARPVRIVKDRTDRLFLGAGRAARHRTLRLIDPAAAAEFRKAALPRSKRAPKASKGASRSAARAIRTRLAALLAPTPISAKMAA